MNKKTTKLSFLFLILSVLSIHAGEIWKNLNIQLTDGNSVLFFLSEMPKIEEKNKILFVKTSLSSSEIPIENITKIYYTEDTQTNNEILQAENDVAIWPNPANDHLYISGINDNTKIIIRNTTGIITPISANQNENYSKIKVEDLPSGAYIIQIDNRFIKFIKK